MIALARWWRIVKARHAVQVWSRRGYPPAVARARQRVDQLRAGS